MIIGIPKEIKKYEFRVGATPAMAHTLAEEGHQVRVERGAGAAVGYTDAMYLAAGAKIAKTPAEVYTCQMIIKVKEPQESEFRYLFDGQILFCYLHLAPDHSLTDHLIESKVIGIAYETVTDKEGKLPLLIPMSEIAGRLAIQAGANALQMNNGGRGVLLGGVPGVPPANVVVIGAGVVGTEAARMAMGLGANVTILDKNIDRLRQLDMQFGPNLKTLYSTTLELGAAVSAADLVIGAVLIPGKTAPKLVTRQMLKRMTPGSVIVDVAIDQGGCVETSRPTNHGQPTFVEEEIIHYCVTNMPGACAKTATMALTNATLDYALKIANQGYSAALRADEGLRKGLNVYRGLVTNPFVAADQGRTYMAPEEMLQGR